MKKYNTWTQVSAFVVRNFNLSRKYLGWEIVFLVYHVVGALAIGFLAKSMDASGAEFQQLLLFLMIGSIMWVYLSSIFHEVGNQISYERWEGTIEYTFMAPIRRVFHLVGNSLFAVIYGVIKTILVLIFVVVLFRIDMSGADLLSAMVILLISALSFIGLGMIVSVIPLMSPEKGSQALHIVEAVLMLVSGIYYDVSVLPGWMQKIAHFSPATYALDGMRDALIDGRGMVDLFGSHIVPLILMGVISIPLGLNVFTLAEKRAKKLGELKRNG